MQLRRSGSLHFLQLNWKCLRSFSIFLHETLNCISEFSLFNEKTECKYCCWKVFFLCRTRFTNCKCGYNTTHCIPLSKPFPGRRCFPVLPTGIQAFTPINYSVWGYSSHLWSPPPVFKQLKCSSCWPLQCCSVAKGPQGRREAINVNSCMSPHTGIY